MMSQWTTALAIMGAGLMVSAGLWLILGLK
jgi:hypothetical protein